MTVEKKIFVKTYGCQMNVADSELISGLLSSEGYNKTSDIHAAGTCTYIILTESLCL